MPVVRAARITESACSARGGDYSGWGCRGKVREAWSTPGVVRSGGAGLKDGMAAHAETKLKYRPPSSIESFLNIPGSLEHLLTGSTPRPRLPDAFTAQSEPVWNVILFLIDGWGWK